MSFVKELIKKAESQIGVQEEPKGSNTGKSVKEYQRRAGYSSPVPWCMCFLYWCIDEVCIDLEIENEAKRTGDCDTFLNWGKSKGIEHQTPEVGDFGFVMKSERDAVHVFLVTGIEGAVLHTVEGNTNDYGSREGYEVCRRRRTLKPTHRFVRVADAMAKPVPTEMFKMIGPDGKEICELEAMRGVAWAPVRKVALAVGMKVGGVIKPLSDADIGWDSEDRTVLINGQAVPGQVLLRDSQSYVPIRKLATVLGFDVNVDCKMVVLM